MKKVVLTAAALVAALGVMASSATSAPAVDGITARTIVIGGTHPLTGPASLYATISTAMKAYFSYANARKGPDGKRGVYGRQIVYKVYDDGYNPAMTVPQVRRLVEQDKVFAVIGALGTEHERGSAALPELEEGAADHQRDRRHDVGPRLQEVPVDGRLAAGLRVRSPALRPGDRAQQPEREDRGAAPERQLRGGQPARV